MVYLHLYNLTVVNFIIRQSFELRNINNQSNFFQNGDVLRLSTNLKTRVLKSTNMCETSTAKINNKWQQKLIILHVGSAKEYEAIAISIAHFITSSNVDAIFVVVFSVTQNW